MDAGESGQLVDEFALGILQSDFHRQLDVPV